MSKEVTAQHQVAELAKLRDSYSEWLVSIKTTIDSIGNKSGTDPVYVCVSQTKSMLVLFIGAMDKILEQK